MVIVSAFVCLSFDPGDLLTGAMLLLDIDKDALCSGHFYQFVCCFGWHVQKPDQVLFVGVPLFGPRASH